MSTVSVKRAGAAQATLLLLASCLPVLCAVLLAPVLPTMQQHFTGQPHAHVLVPIVLTLPALLVGLLGGIAGGLIDRYGRKPLLLIALVIYAVCGTLPLWLDSLTMILASRAGIGVAEALIMTGCTTLIGDYFEAERRDRLLALQTVATSFSATVFIMLGGALGEFGWRTPFAVYTIALVFLPLFYALTWEPQREVRRVDQSLETISSRLPWATLTPIYLLVLFAGLALFIVPVQAGYVLGLIGVSSPSTIGVTMGFNQAGVLLGALSFRWFGRRHPAVLLLGAFTVAGAGILLLGSAKSHAVVGVAVALAGLGCGLMIPTLLRWTMSQVGFETRGQATGLFMACFFLGEFLSPLVIAILGGSGAGLRPALLLVGGGLLVIALLCLLLRRRPPLNPAALSVPADA
jgi:MFS family permease